MEKLQALKYDPFAVGHNNRRKINEIVDWINNQKQSSLPQPLINGNLIYARFVNPENPTQNDFYPVHSIEHKENGLYVIWCNRMTSVLPAEEFEFRAIKSISFNPFNENSESFPEEEKGLIISSDGITLNNEL